jgi:DNA repair protein RecO (recombination protein O)
MKTTPSETTGFILHSRAYRETSQILQVFSPQNGRFSILAKGIKGKGMQPRKAILQPFIPLKLSYTGKSDLKTMTNVETDSIESQAYYQWHGKILACGYYANELILRSCPEDYAYPVLFNAYAELIKNLTSLDDTDSFYLSSILRRFEVILLTELGIAPDWQFDIDETQIVPEASYELIIGQGFNKLSDCDGEKGYASSKQHKYSGQAILSLKKGIYEKAQIKSCQHITSRLLEEIIGHKPLQSRKLWQHTCL